MSLITRQDERRQEHSKTDARYFAWNGEDSKSHEKDEGKDKRELKFESRSAYTQETDENGVFPSLLGFAPELQMHCWEYNMNTVIDNHIDGTRFTVCEYMERKVDSDGIPIKNKEED